VGSALFISKKNGTCKYLYDYNKSHYNYYHHNYSEMYAELAFLQLFVREEEIELPQPVSEDVELERKQKLLLQELEVCVCGN
jgi:hypothetical protein